MIQLFVDLLERVGFLIATAFVISRSSWMRGYMSFRHEQGNHVRFILFFSFYAILGTYSGVKVSNFSYQPAPWIGDVHPQAAIANARTIGVVIAGLLGGVKNGFLVGAVAGIHRYSLGGFVAVPCMIAPMLEGILAGLFQKSMKKYQMQEQSIKLAFMVGLAAEVLQMALILLMTKPWDAAWTLVSLIGIPQVLSNSLGVTLFFMLLRTLEFEQDRIATVHARKALQIADRALPYWKRPFDQATAGITRILLEETIAIGVCFFNRDNECCAKEGQPSEYWIDAPIQKENNKQLGYFRLYYDKKHVAKNPYRRKMLRSLSQLLSQQYVFVEAERQEKLLTDSEIRALQAQMNPHFLFNVLNTVKSFIRTKPDEARIVITQLAKFLRKNMTNSNNTLIPIKDELDLVLAYLNLTKARMGDQFFFETDIEHEVLDRLIPPYTIQPLVENAIVHGINGLDRKGVVKLTVRSDRKQVIIQVEDNGVGMAESWPHRSEEGEESHAGIALYNIEQRLRYHYGTDQALQIESSLGKGTKITFRIR